MRAHWHTSRGIDRIRSVPVRWAVVAPALIHADPAMPLSRFARHHVGERLALVEAEFSQPVDQCVMDRRMDRLVGGAQCVERTPDSVRIIGIGLERLAQGGRRGPIPS